MIRSLFLALGLTTVILGLECLVVEKATLAGPPPQKNTWGQSVAAPPRDVVPPEWAPWGLLTGGAVVLLYSFTIPKRVTGG
ncbi:MAG: hypothetical protein U0935_14150 [Pirellulales bacterium]